MKTLRRIRYYTMCSWNKSTAPAYNLKVYNVIDNKLQNKVYELLEVDEFWQQINHLIRCFNDEHDYQWQAGFNGRSGGYLVLYRGGRSENGGVYVQPGRNVENAEVPAKVLRAFRRLAVRIVQTAETLAKNYKIQDEKYQITKTCKVLVENSQ